MMLFVMEFVERIMAHTIRFDRGAFISENKKERPARPTVSKRVEVALVTTNVNVT